MNAQLALDGTISTVSPAPTWVTSTLLLARRNVLKTLRSPAFVSFSLLQPVVWLVLFSALQSGLSVVTDLDSGMLDKLRTDPIARSSILAGRLIADAALMVAQAALVL